MTINIDMILALGCAIVIAACATFLVFNSKYEDGVIGRACLIAMVFSAFALGASAADGYNTGVFELENRAVVVWCALAIFLLRHTYRFHRYIKRRGSYMQSIARRRASDLNVLDDRWEGH